MPSHPLSDDDLRHLRERGMLLEDVLEHLSVFASPPAPIRLDRPATVGDGIDVLTEEQEEARIALHAAAARQGRITKFIPASGAATRMFRDLLAARASGERSPALRTFVESLPRFAFHGDLANELARRGIDLDRRIEEGEYAEILDALLDREGLGYADLPKGVLKFHRHARGGRTPLEEHLVEAVETARDETGTARLHFTVSPEHRATFEELLERVRESYETRYGTRFEVGFSVQEPSTDTIAVDPENRPFRDDAGRLLFRPSGHGALLENLHALEGDVVLVRNIDNVAPETRSETTHRFKKVLIGHLLDLEDEVKGRIRALRKGTAAIPDALDLATEKLHLETPPRFAERSPEERRAWLLDRLRRPLRVCGVVKNTGEPGGGPFWVVGGDGTRTLQIVESAQVDRRSEEQKAILARSTHFNPVDIACAVRDENGEPYDLRLYVDASAVILTRKSWGGRDLVALERPGLWNGAMAGWNTVFLEVPGSTFTPVKEVNDLLRDEHQPD
jgi:hypothetical protein